MQANQLPTKIQSAFASGANAAKNTIPVASQIGITPGAASFADGFPPLTMQPLAAGGVPPSGKDFNGILYAITAVLQWECAGGFFTYDAAFAAANNGYPKGAVLQSTGTNDLWLNQIDSNTTNPDATDGSAANWVSLASYGIGAVTGLTNANVTLTPAQYSKRIITLAGALTGNVQIVAPNSQRDYTFINNTTGAYTVTVKTAAGTGIAIPQGQLQSVYCDGTNILSEHAPAVGNAAQTFLVGAATLSGHAVNLGQFISSKVTNGYLKLPGGLILQWGQNSGSSGGGQTYNFPISFPNACLNIIGVNSNAPGSFSHPNIYSVSTTTFQASMVYMNTSATSVYTTDAFYWFALGF